MPKKGRRRQFRPKSAYKVAKKRAAAEDGRPGPAAPAAQPALPLSPDAASSESESEAAEQRKSCDEHDISHGEDTATTDVVLSAEPAEPAVLPTHPVAPQLIVVQLPQPLGPSVERRSVHHNDHNYCKDSSIDGNEKVSASVCEAVMGDIGNTVEIETGVSNHTSSPAVCTENDPTIQFMGALEQLEKSLPSLWIPIITQNGLNIIKVSDGQDAVTQRSVGISASGEVKYFVHGKEVPTSHEVYSDNYGNVKVSNVDEIIASVSAVVAHFRKFDVCCGVPHPKYKMFWKSTRDSVVDKNPFKEMRYCETLRSESCLLVVNQQKRMCSICFSLSKRLCSRMKNFQKNTSPSTGKIRTPSKFKPWKTLITPEKKARQEKCQKIIEGLSRENARLKAKLANLIDTEGIKMKNSKQSNEFKDLIEEAKKTTTDPLHRLFLEQQLHALSLSDRHSMKWHPMMIRLALRIKMISSAAYNELASSGFVVLPSERTFE